MVILKKYDQRYLAISLQKCIFPIFSNENSNFFNLTQSSNVGWNAEWVIGMIAVRGRGGGTIQKKVPVTGGNCIFYHFIKLEKLDFLQLEKLDILVYQPLEKKSALNPALGSRWWRAGHWRPRTLPAGLTR